MVSDQIRRVLLVDDDVRLLAQLSDRLEHDGFDVQPARSGPEALAHFATFGPDIVVLDLMMPGMDGEETAERLLRLGDVPIIVLSAITAAESKVKFIERYAEDYVTKPFEYEELRARIKRVSHRLGQRVRERELRLGPDLTLVLGRREAWVSGRRVPLSPIEVRLLAALAREPGHPVRTDQLVAHGWSEVDAADESFVWVSIRRLRQKIEADPDHPRYLVTERGVGYRLVPAAS
ncbi:MAG: response regulator transcription factor [Candidatus Limnocylindrales bacterium]